MKPPRIDVNPQNIHRHSLSHTHTFPHCPGLVGQWWFEVAEMYRRVVFVGVLPLASPNSATKASLGCVLAMASVVYFNSTSPYRVPYTNFIAYTAQYVILIVFYAALAIDTGVMVRTAVAHAPAPATEL